MPKVPPSILSDLYEPYLQARKKEVGLWFAQGSLKEIQLLQTELSRLRLPRTMLSGSWLIGGNTTFPLYQHLSPALAAWSTGRAVQLLLPTTLPETTILLQKIIERLNKYRPILATSVLPDPEYMDDPATRIWCQNAYWNHLLPRQQLSEPGIFSPGPIPWFIDESGNLEQAKMLLHHLSIYRPAGFLPDQFWMPAFLKKKFLEIVPPELAAGTWPEYRADEEWPKTSAHPMLITYRSVREVVKRLRKEAPPNLIYWFSRYKPHVRAVQDLSSLTGIALNGFLPALQNNKLEIGQQRASWLGPKQNTLGFSAVRGTSQ